MGSENGRAANGCAGAKKRAPTTSIEYSTSYDVIMLIIRLLLRIQRLCICFFSFHHYSMLTRNHPSAPPHRNRSHTSLTPLLRLLQNISDATLNRRQPAKSQKASSFPARTRQISLRNPSFISHQVQNEMQTKHDDLRSFQHSPHRPR